MGQTTLSIDWTTTIAIYAAVVATGTLLWDWWKWKYAGPKLFVKAQVGLAMTSGDSISDERYITCTATNRGDRSTTITHFTLHQYGSWLSWARNRAQYNAVVNTWGHGAGNQTPHVLDPGKVWMGVARQTPDIVELAKEGRLYLGVTHSHSPKSVRIRVRPI